MANHYLYKITNQKNKKYYYGVRTCDCPIEEDSYFGSGVLLKRSLKFWGKESFIKEVLLTFESKLLAFEFEELLVDQELVDRRSCYNVALGGFGGNRGDAIHEIIGKKCSETYRNKSQAEKDKITKHLKSIRPLVKMTEVGRDKLRRSKLGDKNPSFKGYWFTPLGKFDSAIVAGVAHDVDKTTIHRRCKNPLPRWNEWYFEGCKEVQGD